MIKHLYACIVCSLLDPTTKWFGGYIGQRTCVIDEFRGRISIEHLLRWFDKYPVRVETKGGFVPLLVERWYITSNLAPDLWYPELDEDTREALKRRLKVTHFPFKYVEQQETSE